MVFAERACPAAATSEPRFVLTMSSRQPACPELARCGGHSRRERLREGNCLRFLRTCEGSAVRLSRHSLALRNEGPLFLSRHRRRRNANGTGRGLPACPDEGKAWAGVRIPDPCTAAIPAPPGSGNPLAHCGSCEYRTAAALAFVGARLTLPACAGLPACPHIFSSALVGALLVCPDGGRAAPARLAGSRCACRAVCPSLNP